jgi:hypothetical protein
MNTLVVTEVLPLPDAIAEALRLSPNLAAVAIAAAVAVVEEDARTGPWNYELLKNLPTKPPNKRPRNAEAVHITIVEAGQIRVFTARQQGKKLAWSSGTYITVRAGCWSAAVGGVSFREVRDGIMSRHHP